MLEGYQYGNTLLAPEEMKVRRVRKNLSLDHAATLVGLSARELEAYEEGQRVIPVGNLRALLVEYEMATATGEEARSPARSRLLPNLRKRRPSYPALPKTYADAVPLEHRKKFGQFFTPPSVASLMADWVVRDTRLLILDPALGTGALASACLAKDPTCQVIGYEKDLTVLEFVPSALTRSLTINPTDFLATEVESHFDGVIMNPPYIRHREITEKEPFRSDISARSGCQIPTSANLYLYFMLKALTVTKVGARLAFLIPSEWMSANFSASFKRFLIDRGYLRQIVTFSNCSNVFDDALTTASLLLLECVE